MLTFAEESLLAKVGDPLCKAGGKGEEKKKEQLAFVFDHKLKMKKNLRMPVLWYFKGRISQSEIKLHVHFTYFS